MRIIYAASTPGFMYIRINSFNKMERITGLFVRTLAKCWYHPLSAVQTKRRISIHVVSKIR